MLFKSYSQQLYHPPPQDQFSYITTNSRNKEDIAKVVNCLNEIYIMIIIISIQKGDTRSSKIKVIILNRINIKRSLENMTAGGIESPETHMIMNLLTPLKYV